MLFDFSCWHTVNSQSEGSVLWSWCRMVDVCGFATFVASDNKRWYFLLVCFALQLVMAKFRKYEKQALELHSKKKAEREDNEKKRKDRLAQKKKEEEIIDAKAEASITELTDDEALQLQKEIDKVYVIVSFLVVNMMFLSSVHVNQLPSV